MSGKNVQNEKMMKKSQSPPFRLRWDFQTLGIGQYRPLYDYTDCCQTVFCHCIILLRVIYTHLCGPSFANSITRLFCLLSLSLLVGYVVPVMMSRDLTVIVGQMMFRRSIPTISGDGTHSLVGRGGRSRERVGIMCTVLII